MDDDAVTIEVELQEYVGAELTVMEGMRNLLLGLACCNMEFEMCGDYPIYSLMVQVYFILLRVSKAVWYLV